MAAATKLATAKPARRDAIHQDAASRRQDRLHQTSLLIRAPHRLPRRGPRTAKDQGGASERPPSHVTPKPCRAVWRRKDQRQAGRQLRHRVSEAARSLCMAGQLKERDRLTHRSEKNASAAEPDYAPSGRFAALARTRHSDRALGARPRSLAVVAEEDLLEVVMLTDGTSHRGSRQRESSNSCSNRE